MSRIVQLSKPPDYKLNDSAPLALAVCPKDPILNMVDKFAYMLMVDKFAHMLKVAGFNALTAQTLDDAMRILESKRNELALLFTYNHVTSMPWMSRDFNIRQFAANALAGSPPIPVVVVVNSSREGNDVINGTIPLIMTFDTNVVKKDSPLYRGGNMNNSLQQALEQAGFEFE